MSSPLQSAADLEACWSVVVPVGHLSQVEAAEKPLLYSPLGQGATCPGPFRK